MKKIIYRISTIKLIFKNLTAFKNLSVQRSQRLFENGFLMDPKEVPYQVDHELFRNNGFLNRLTYKNEDWEVVKYRFHDRFLKFFNLPTRSKDNDCFDNKCRIVNNNLYFKSRGLKDDWIYFYLQDLSLHNYTLNFDAVFQSKFREIQFGFRYLDFYNRYRFRIEDNYLHFDVVRKGQFYNSLVSVPLHLQCNKSYAFNIVVKDDKYSFLCDRKVLMTVIDRVGIFKKGAVALILWDDSGESNIEGSYQNVRFDQIS